jgi:(1->4)-alpha-D-glucan 1-alpha-D-glucosylmutase
MVVMARALAQRGILREVYDSGSFVPLSVEGDHRSHVFAFARRHADAVAITCVPRLVAGLLGHQSGPPVGAAVWGETRILLPWATARPTKFRDAITGAQIEAHADGDAAWLDASAVFGQFPAALLVPVG